MEEEASLKVKVRENSLYLQVRRATMCVWCTAHSSASMQSVLHRAAPKKGNTVKFGEPKCWIEDSLVKLKGMGQAYGKLYQLKCKVIIAQEKASVVSGDVSDIHL